jgi:hypothetical protein
MIEIRVTQNVLTAKTNRRNAIGRTVCSILLLCWVAVETSVLGAQLTQTDWLRADAATVRLNPGSFPNLPSPIRTEMGRRGCTVPQPFGSDGQRNIISGHFTDAKRRSWAALCSRGRRSAVLVFHGNDFSEVDELAEAADSDYLQTVEGGRIGYSRALGVATPNIVRRAPVADGPKPQVIDHDGINDAFEGKGSTILYWIGEKWIRLQGSD